MNKQQENNGKPPVNGLLIACHFVSLPVELLLHNVKTFGIRSVGPRIGGALLLMFLFVAFHPDENCRFLVGFMIAVAALGSVAQISAMMRQRRGQASHSRYAGRPYLMWALPNWSEITIKRLEPIVIWAAGGVIHHFNHPLGSFLIASAVGLGIKVGAEYRGMRARSLDISDALISQKISIERVRNGQRR